MSPNVRTPFRHCPLHIATPETKESLPCNLHVAVLKLQDLSKKWARQEFALEVVVFNEQQLFQQASAIEDMVVCWKPL